MVAKTVHEELDNTLSGRIRAAALMKWLKLPAWKVEDRGFEPHSDIQQIQH